MVTTISPKPNTFYIKKDVVDDVGITPCYADTYEGMGTTFDLDSNPKTTYLLGESKVITPTDYIYGEGKINEMYLSAYANTLTQINPQTAPYVDVYNMKPNLDFTEGDMTITSGETGLISTFTSWYDFGAPWLSENFDGTEKHFYNVSTRKPPPPVHHSMILSYQIQMSDLMKVVKKWQDEEIEKQEKDNESQGILAGWWASGRKAWDDAVNWTRDLEYTGQILPLHGEGWFNSGQYKEGGSTGDLTVMIKRHKSGIYYADIEGSLSMGKVTKWGMKNILNLVKENGLSLSEWLDAGASPRGTTGIMMGAQYKKSNFGEDYYTKADATNTIFSDIFMDGDVRDIKTQTEQSPGDDQHFLAYGYTNIIGGESYSDGHALQAKLSWENYSSLTDGENDPQKSSGSTAQNIANPFGRNPAPHTQDIVMSIHGIPMPYSFDLSRPLMSGSAFAPELEIIFKINKMDVAPLWNTGDSLFERSFNIIGATKAPVGDEKMLGDYDAPFNPNSWWVSFLNTGSSTDGNDMVDVFANNRSHHVGGCSDISKSHVYISDPANVTGTTNHTQIPKGKWITARVKFQQRMTGGGDSVMMYFPNELDETGMMKFVQIDIENNFTNTDAWYNHLTFWINNMRSMNSDVLGSSASSNINAYYDNDYIMNDDKEVDIIIDSINFYGWNVETQNSTVTMNNGTGQMLTLPSAYATPCAMNDTTGSALPTNQSKISIVSGTAGTPDNIYGQISVPIATYLSIGYEKPDWSPQNRNSSPATGSLFTEGHHLLFNDFYTSRPESIRPITLISGAAFNSDTYPDEQYDWFNSNYDGSNGGLSVGTLPTNNIMVGASGSFVDNFTQKGMIRVSGTTTDGFRNWRRTGNPYVCAKILNVDDNGTTITVDNPSIFNLPDEQEYVIEKILAYDYNNSLRDGVYSMGYQGALAPYLSGTLNKITARPLGGNQIELSRSVLSTDHGDGTGDGTGDSGEKLIDYNIKNSAFGLGQYMISPFKYWIVMAMINVSGASATGWGDWYETGIPDDAGVGSASMTVKSTALANIDGEYFQLSGALGDSNYSVIKYTFNLAAEPDSDDTTSIGIKNLTTATDLAHHMTNCINRVDTLSGSNIHASVAVPGTPAELSLTQSLRSTQGNTDIESDIDAAHITFVDFTGGSAGTGGEWPQEPTPNASITRQPTRSYSNVVAVSGGGTVGTTFNESTFTDGIYANRWNISFWNPDDSILNLTTNYGYGAITNEEDETAISSDGGIGYMGRDFIVSGQNYINISNYVRMSKPKEGDDFNFLMKPTYDDADLARYTININTDDAATNKIQVLYGVLDLAPTIDDFTVQPTVREEDLEAGTLKPGAANVNFQWTEKNKDTWYRLLFVDNQDIQNKYHNINFWAPLNERVNVNVQGASPTYGYYTSPGDTVATAFANSGNLTADIEGFCGYGAKFDGTDDVLISSGNTNFAVAASNWSLLVHCRPAAVSGNVFDISNLTAPSGVSQFRIFLSSNRIVAEDSGSSVSLTSTNRYECDGVQPLAIATTFEKNIPDNNWKLIINGKLEDTADYTSAITISGSTFVGALGYKTTAGYTPFFEGFIEEITSYSGTTVHFPPNANNHTFNMSGYDDVVSGTTTNESKQYTGRLFVADYHNIRGKGPRDVGRSDMASWKVTGI